MMGGAEGQEKACEGDSFYYTSQRTAQITGLSSVTIRGGIFSHRKLGCKCLACPQKWPMLLAVRSQRREEYSFLKCIGSLKPKCKGRTNQLCTWFQLSFPVSMLQYGLSSILSLAVAKTYMHLREEVVLRTLVAASDVPGSCLSFLRGGMCWLCVFGKRHSPARLPLLENTALLDNYCLGKSLSRQEQ